LPLKYELRSVYSYDNIAYTAAVHAAEIATSQDFATLLRNEILQPLGMHDTVYTFTEAHRIVEADNALQLAACYESKDGMFLPVSPERIAPSQGQGGIISTAHDMAKWMKHLLTPSNIRPGQGTNVVQAMTTPKMLKQPAVVQPFLGTHTYGLGLDLAVYQGRRIAWHGGTGAGSQSMMLLALPSTKVDGSMDDDGFGVFVVHNSKSEARNIIAWHVVDSYLMVPEAGHRQLAKAAHKAKAKRGRVSEFSPNGEPDRTSRAEHSFPPRLPITAYQGLYRHRAYHGLRVSTSPPQGRTPIATSSIPETRSLCLYLSPETTKAAFGLCVRLEHLSQDLWHSAPTITGSGFLKDVAKSIHFILDSNGQVLGLEAPAEPAMPEVMARFDRVAEAQDAL
jgi:hypothetical protein